MLKRNLNINISLWKKFFTTDLLQFQNALTVYEYLFIRVSAPDNLWLTNILLDLNLVNLVLHENIFIFLYEKKKDVVADDN